MSNVEIQYLPNTQQLNCHIGSYVLLYFYRTRVRSLAMLVSNSLTDSLTHCCLVNLIDVTLACADANSKLIEFVTAADVYDEKRVDNSLVQVCSLVIKSSFCSDFEHKYSRFGQDIEVDVQARF